MNKVAIFQKSPPFLKSVLASFHGFQLNRIRKKNRKQYLIEIKKHDSWTKENIREFQNKKLEEILDYSVKNIPYYRNLWKKLKSDDPQLDHLNIKNWPILEKETIRSNPQQFLSDSINKKELINIKTSGTSGKPISFWYDNYAISYWYALCEHRIKNWNGVGEKDNWANIGGQLICDINKNKPPFWTWNLAMKQLYLSSYHISPGNIKFYLTALKKYRIKYIWGYVSSIFNIAKEGLLQNLDFPKLSLIITNAEPLFEHQKIIIEKAFGCAVIQTYSSCEFAFGSNEDLEGNMFIWPEAGFIETLSESEVISTSGQGQLIITGFLNKAMPIIRYRLGDTAKVNIGQKGDKNFDYFEEIIGRTDDLVVSSEGKFVGRLDPVFKSDLKIKEAQIIQEDYSLFTIKVTPDLDFSDKDMISIECGLKDRVGQNIKVNFEIVDSIPRGANGKFKAVISHVKTNL